VVQRVALLLEPLDLHAGVEHRPVLVPLQRPDRHQQLLGGPHDHVRDEHRALGRAPRVEDVEPAGGAVDQVHHVVQPGGQRVNILPVERGDEHPVQPAHDVVSHLVGQVLQALDLVHDHAAAVLLGPQQLLLQAGGLHGVLGDRGEEVKELLVAGQEAHGHVRVTGRGKITPPLGSRILDAHSLTPRVSPPDSPGPPLRAPASPRFRVPRFL
jgi:hypothetical protein